MKRKLFADIGFNNLDSKQYQKEKKYNSLNFKVNVFKKCQEKKTIFVLGFVEFGCEAFYPHYILPQIIKANKNYKIIFVGWPGRHYYYRHLVHEYWEIQGDYFSLRCSARAMFNESFTIKKLEFALKKLGIVVNSQSLGNQLVECMCLKCKYRIGSIKNINVCPKCFSNNLRQSVLSDAGYFQKNFFELPKLERTFDVPAKSVAIFARKRNAYGRNLSSDFYKQLIIKLKNMGYNPIWLGESYSTLSCPDNTILNFTSNGDIPLEKTIQIVSECEFSIQFWTASTRISIHANTPFLIVESPDQIYGKGQEGVRLKLLNQKKVPYKLILCDFKKFVENEEESLNVIEKSIHEFMIDANYNDYIGLVNNQEFVLDLKNG